MDDKMPVSGLLAANTLTEHYRAPSQIDAAAQMRAQHGAGNVEVICTSGAQSENVRNRGTRITLREFFTRFFPVGK